MAVLVVRTSARCGEVLGEVLGGGTWECVGDYVV